MISLYKLISKIFCDFFSQLNIYLSQFIYEGYTNLKGHILYMFVSGHKDRGTSDTSACSRFSLVS